ncbi:MFS transporter [Rhizocola hellebori]|uniref:MFS transporter n=1 Tax=Rhizocola hellebori TaxID=1392758 RepID=A0A8J3Q6F4_9ACTN|nr:MFS transporter [Rhizocola hellebori]GIH04681.1 MFS transporter [Rhizocola hellebori]
MADKPATYREVFAVPAFRVLFASRSLAIAANTLRIVALSLLVFAATKSTLLSAIAFGIGFMPQVAGGLLLGSLADRWRPRPLIVTGFLVEAAVAVLLAAFAMPIWLTLGLVALAAAFAPIFSGAANRVISEVLTGDTYVLGRSLATISAGAAQIAGMAVGGLAVAAAGPRRALLLSALCLLVSASIVAIRLPNFERPPSADKRSAVAQSWSTNVELFGDRGIRRLLMVQWLPPAFVVGGQALIVAYCAHRGFTPGMTGAMLAAAPAGMLAGDLVVGRLVRPTVRTRLVAPLIALLGIPLILLAVNPPPAVSVIALGFGGAGFSYLLGLQQAFLDAVPVPHRGQAFGLLGTGLMTLQGLGPLAFGALGQLAGIGPAMAVAGVAALCSAGVWAMASRSRDAIAVTP